MGQSRVTIRGKDGVLRWGYFPAATLGSWVVTAEPAGNTLTAQVVSHDALRVSQQPLTFVVTRPNGYAWTWPVQSLQIAGSTVTARLGVQE